MLDGNTKNASEEDAEGERVERPFMHSFSGTASPFADWLLIGLQIGIGLERGTNRHQQAAGAHPMDTHHSREVLHGVLYPGAH
jgi:hypothetical protein